MRRHVQAGIEALRQQGQVTAAGVVSATGDGGLSEVSLFQMAEKALQSAWSQPTPRLARVVVGPGTP